MCFLLYTNKKEEKRNEKGNKKVTTKGNIMCSQETKKNRARVICAFAFMAKKRKRKSRLLSLVKAGSKDLNASFSIINVHFPYCYQSFCSIY